MLLTYLLTYLNDVCVCVFMMLADNGCICQLNAEYTVCSTASACILWCFLAISWLANMQNV